MVLFFKVLINLSATTDFPSLCAEYISVSFFLTMLRFHRAIVKFTANIKPYFVWFSIRFFKNFLKSVGNCNIFFIFQKYPCIFATNVNYS